MSQIVLVPACFDLECNNSPTYQYTAQKQSYLALAVACNVESHRNMARRYAEIIATKNNMGTVSEAPFSLRLNEGSHGHGKEAK